MPHNDRHFLFGTGKVFEYDLKVSCTLLFRVKSYSLILAISFGKETPLKKVKLLTSFFFLCVITAYEAVNER
jgi:hypothetical protein